MNKLLFLLLLSAGVAHAQVNGNQNNVAGNSSIVGAALNTQQNNNNTSTNSNNLSNSNNDSGNTTVYGGSVGAGGTLVNQAQAPSSTTVRNIGTPNLYAPNLTSSGLDTCLGSFSGGFSVLGFGATGGGTTSDTNCVMIKQTKLLAELGLKDAAVARLLQEKGVREALLIAYPALARLAPGEEGKGEKGNEKSGNFVFINEK